MSSTMTSLGSSGSGGRVSVLHLEHDPRDRRMIESQRERLGLGAGAAWSRGWHMSAEQVMEYASENG